VASYKQLTLDTGWDAIVIGSGIGGLTAAALLSKHGGKRVLVLERHYTAGGYTHGFHRPGYEWDVGVHYIGDVQDESSPVRVAFDHLTDGALRWSPMPDVYDRFDIGGRMYEFPTGVERFQEQLIGYFPAEGAAIRGYVAAVNATRKASGLYFAEKAMPRPVARIAGGLMRGALPPLGGPHHARGTADPHLERRSDRPAHRSVGQLRIAPCAEQLWDSRRRGGPLLQRRQLPRRRRLQDP